MVYVGLFAATVVAAAETVEAWGVVPIGFGLYAPAGSVCAGLALILRDEIQARLGPWWAVGAVVVGASVCAVTATPALALASAVAFAVAELADMAVFSRLRSRPYLARLASNALSGPLDSVLFLTLAGFGASWTAVLGQTVVKVVYLAPLAIAYGRFAARSR